MMLVIKFLKWAIEAINFQMSNFFWDDKEEKHKYHLSNWQSLTQRKEQDGMGIPDLRILNLCLLASWVQMYYDDEYKLWRKFVDCKYQSNAPNMFCCNVRNVSPF
jgi:hypothetical protein